MRSMQDYLIRKAACTIIRENLSDITVLIVEDREDTVKKILAEEPIDVVVGERELEGMIKYYKATMKRHHGNTSVNLELISVVPDKGLHVAFDKLIGKQV